MHHGILVASNPNIYKMFANNRIGIQDLIQILKKILLVELYWWGRNYIEAYQITTSLTKLY
jgi:hypothetical protein